MRKRVGFVSNSSSASFIINFSSEKSWKEIEHYIYESEPNLIEVWNEHKLKKYDWEKVFQKGLKNKLDEEVEIDGDPRRNNFIDKGNGKYALNSSSTMFNDWMSMPYWKFIRALDEGRIKGLKLDSIIQTEDEYDLVENEVKFNSKTWEYESSLDDSDYNNNMSQQEKNDIILEQNETDLSYKEYLSNLGEFISEEEKLEVVKFLLNK